MRTALWCISNLVISLVGSPLENLFVKLHTCSVCRLGHLFLGKLTHLAIFPTSNSLLPFHFPLIGQNIRYYIKSGELWLTRLHIHLQFTSAVAKYVLVSVDKLLLQGPHYLRPGWHSSSVSRKSNGLVFGSLEASCPSPIFVSPSDPCLIQP